MAITVNLRYTGKDGMVHIRDQLARTSGEEFAHSVYQAYIADERYLRAAWDAMGPDYLHETLHLEDTAVESFRKAVLTM